MGGEDGADAIDFLDGERVERVVRGVGGVVVVVARGFVAFSEGIVVVESFSVERVLGVAPRRLGGARIEEKGAVRRRVWEVGPCDEQESS